MQYKILKLVCLVYAACILYFIVQLIAIVKR